MVRLVGVVYPHKANHIFHLSSFIFLLSSVFLFCSSVLPCSASGAVAAGEEQNEARRIFDDAYNMVFGPQGSTLHYDVNLVGVYKTEGTIWYKGKKSKFEDNKLMQWNDGQTVYALFKKKKTIEIYDAKTGRHDKYASKFKFTLDDFDYSMERKDDNIIINMKQRHGAKGTVKQAKVVLDARTHAPKGAKVKVTFFWANIKISNFRSGGIADNIFVFPRERYGDEYKYHDKR